MRLGEKLGESENSGPHWVETSSEVGRCHRGGSNGSKRGLTPPNLPLCGRWLRKHVLLVTPDAVHIRKGILMGENYAFSHLKPFRLSPDIISLRVTLGFHFHFREVGSTREVKTYPLSRLKYLWNIVGFRRVHIPCFQTLAWYKFWRKILRVSCLLQEIGSTKEDIT